MQAVTSTSPLHHTQVCCHHPIMVHKTSCNTAPTPSKHSMHARLQHQPALRKPRHGANPPHTSPTMVCKLHCYIPTQRHLPNGYDYMGKRYLVMDLFISQLEYHMYDSMTQT